MQTQAQTIIFKRSTEMRDLTENERAIICQRKSSLDAFIEDSIVVLLDFGTELGVDRSPYLVRTPQLYVDIVNSHLKDVVFKPDERIMAIFVVGSFIAEFFSREFGGYWHVDDDPDSPYFSQYVVGHFSALGNTTFRISPAALAA